MSNVLILLVVSGLYSLSLWSYQTRASIESSLSYPADIIVFQPVLPPKSSEPIHDYKTSAHVLGKLIDTGKLGFAGGLRYDYISKKEPAMRVSDNLIDLGILQVTDVSAHEPHRVIAQYGGPYQLGDNSAFGTITTIVNPLWIRNTSLTDVALLVVDHAFQHNPSNDFYTFYLRSLETHSPEELLRHIEAYTGRAYTYQPLYEFIFATEYGLETYQVYLQQIAVAMLLLSLFLTIFSAISHSWYQQREILRIERVLGRSRDYFIIKWFLISIHKWFWGLCLATAGISIYLLFADSLTHGAVLTLLMWFFAITTFGLCVTGIISYFSSQFPLARINAETEQGFRDLITPIIITFSLVFGISYLFSNNLTLWSMSSQVSQSLGINTLLASTTPTARQPIPDDLCSAIADILCVNIGVAAAGLWGPEYLALATEESYQKLMQLDFEHADMLNLKLTAGRFPQQGQREVAIHENLVPALKAVNPAFALGDFLDLGYQVVGKIATPETDGFLLDQQSIYGAFFYIPKDAPQLPDRYFLAPTGRSALVIQAGAGENPDWIKRSLRRSYSDLEFSQPAEFARLYAEQMQLSLTRFLVIFLLLLFLVGLAYYNLTAGTLSRRSLEIGVWRVLGMNIMNLYLRILKPLVLTLSFSGLLATICACLLLSLNQQADGVLPAAVGGIVATLILILICLMITYQKVQSLRLKNIAVNVNRS